MCYYNPQISGRNEITKRIRLNEQITASEVRLIDEDGAQVGVVPTTEALRRAQEAELDLAEISPNAKPPVVKILDWGKYRYEQTKQQQKSRQNQRQIEVKQVRLGLKTDEHDIMVKVRASERFLKAGNKVKVNVRFRGREIARPELGHAVLNDFYERLKEIAERESEAAMNGRELSIVLTRRKNA